MGDPNISELLSRAEETFDRKDSIGNFESQHSDRRWESPLYYPIVNEKLVRIDPGWLNDVIWPDSKKFAVCLTHDVDTVQVNSRLELSRRIMVLARYSRSTAELLKCLSSFVGLRRSPATIDIFSPWIELEKRFGFHSSFFLSATRVSKKHPRDNAYRLDDMMYYQGAKASVAEAVRDIYRQGWDVGLHGSFLSAVEYNLLAEQKEDLETVLGHQVYTTRQHNLRFDMGITPGIQEKAGFQADSTLGFNRDVGFRSGIAYPFSMWDVNEKRWLRLLQIPLNLHDGALLRGDNLDLRAEIAYDVCRRIIDRVIPTKGVVTLSWHPDCVLRPEWWSLYKRLLTYVHKQQGWGASLREVSDWWINQRFPHRLEGLISKIELDGVS